MKPFFNSSATGILFPLFILGLNVFLRFTNLVERDISLDEPFSIYHAQFDPPLIIKFLSQYNNPPLFELILHYWIRWFGIEPLAVRILPAIFSVAASVALYFLGKKHFSIHTGMVAALLLTFSNLSQSYAHDCRVYSLFLLLSILSMHVFLTILKSKSWTNLLLFVIVSILNMYAHYFAIILLAVQMLMVILYARSFLNYFLLGVFTITLLYLPHIFVLLERFMHSTENGTWVQPPSGVESLYNLLWSFSNQPLTTVISLVLFAGLLIRFKRTETNSKLVLCWFIIPVFGVFILSYKIPMFLDRYMIFVLPAWYLLLGNVTDQYGNSKQVKLSVAVILCAAYLFTFQFNSWTKRDVEKAVSFVKKQHDTSSIVLVNPVDFIENFAYHYNKTYFQSVNPHHEYFLLNSLFSKEHIYFLSNISGLHKNLLSAKKIIYFDYGKPADSKQFITKLNEIMKLRSDTVFQNGYRVMIFEKSTAL